MKISLVLLALLVLQVSDVFGGTFGQAIKTEKVNGIDVEYCEYKQHRLLPKSVFKDYESCVICYCKHGGLTCSSMNFPVNVPDDSACVSVSIGCKNFWVLRNNKNERCPNKLIPGSISAAGK